MRWDCGVWEEKIITRFEKEGGLLSSIKLTDSELWDLLSDSV